MVDSSRTHFSTFYDGVKNAGHDVNTAVRADAGQPGQRVYYTDVRISDGSKRSQAVKSLGHFVTNNRPAPSDKEIAGANAIRQMIKNELGDRLGQQVIDGLGIGNAQKLSFHSLARIETAVDSAKTDLQDAVTQARQDLAQPGQAQRVDRDAFMQAGLPLGNDVQATLSKGGSGGAIYLTPPQGDKVLIKIEDSYDHAQAQLVSDLSNALPQDAAFPHVVPHMSVHAFDGQIDGPLANLLDRTETEDDDPRLDRLKDKVGDENCAVGKYEMLKGKPPNTMAVPEKIALVTSSDFPQQLGRMAVSGGILGLNDHVGMRNFGNPNPTNLLRMDDGQLGFIDLAVQARFVGQNDDAPTYGWEPNRLTSALDKLCLCINDMQAQGARAVAGLLADQRRDGPFTETIDAFMRADTDDSMFSPDQKAEMELMLTPQDELKFLANLLLGALEAADYLCTNRDVIGDAVDTVDTVNTFTSGNDIKNIAGGYADRISASLAQARVLLQPYI